MVVKKVLNVHSVVLEIGDMLVMFFVQRQVFIVEKSSVIRRNFTMYKKNTRIITK